MDAQPPQKIPRRKKKAPPIPTSTIVTSSENNASAPASESTTDEFFNAAVVSPVAPPFVPIHQTHQATAAPNQIPTNNSPPPAAEFASSSSSTLPPQLPLQAQMRLNHTPIAGLQTTFPRDYHRLAEALQFIWPQMAEHMQFTAEDIGNLIPMQANQFDISEAAVLLAVWGDQLNHTVTELFVLLSCARQPDIMNKMRHLVPMEYHALIQQTQDELRKSPTAAGAAAAASPPSFSDEENATPMPLAGQPLPLVAQNQDSNRTPSTTTASAKDRNDANEHRNNIDQLASHIPRIPFDELSAATRNWSDKHVLGAGGFGKVYHGRWKNTAVAIKRIKSATTTPTTTPMTPAAQLEQQQGWNELRHLNACRHDNILPLYGFSMGPDGSPCLVYKLMTGGSLEFRLFGKSPPLLWHERTRIAIGTARGLQYMHTLNKVPIIHGDIKPANILLDDCCEPKIGDFGLTRIGADDDADVAVSRVFGTRPYLPREFMLEKILNTKVDTYSFGVVLLELATGLRALNREYGFLYKHVRQMDETSRLQLQPPLPGSPDQNRFWFQLLLWRGLQCTAAEAADRPEMVQVMAGLEGV